MDVLILFSMRTFDQVLVGVVILKPHCFSDVTRTQGYLRLGREPTIPDLGGTQACWLLIETVHLVSGFTEPQVLRLDTEIHCETVSGSE